MNNLFEIDEDTLKSVIDLLDSTMFLKDEEHGLKVAKLVKHLQFNVLCKGPVNLLREKSKL